MCSASFLTRNQGCFWLRIDHSALKKTSCLQLFLWLGETKIEKAANSSTEFTGELNVTKFNTVPRNCGPSLLRLKLNLALGYTVTHPPVCQGTVWILALWNWSTERGRESFFLLFIVFLLSKQTRQQAGVASAHFEKLSIMVCPNRVPETVYRARVILSSSSASLNLPLGFFVCVCSQEVPDLMHSTWGALFSLHSFHDGSQGNTECTAIRIKREWKNEEH